MKAKIYELYKKHTHGIISTEEFISKMNDLFTEKFGSNYSIYTFELALHGDSSAFDEDDSFRKASSKGWAQAMGWLDNRGRP